VASEGHVEEALRHQAAVRVEGAVDELLLSGVVLQSAVLDRVAEVLEALEAAGVDPLEDGPEFPVLAAGPPNLGLRQA
jgi:hypothetical protein